MQIEIEVIGHSCHGSMPWEGLNPLEYGGEILKEAAEQYQRKEGFKTHPFLGEGSRTASESWLETPSDCAVPARFRFRFDRRITIGENPKDVSFSLYCNNGLTFFSVSLLSTASPPWRRPVMPVLPSTSSSPSTRSPLTPATVLTTRLSTSHGLPPRSTLASPLPLTPTSVSSLPTLLPTTPTTKVTCVAIPVLPLGFSPPTVLVSPLRRVCWGLLHLVLILFFSVLTFLDHPTIKVPDTKQWVHDEDFKYPPMFGIGAGLEQHCHKLGEYVDSRDVMHACAHLARFPSLFYESTRKN